jgi:hypothetical protein
MNPENIHKLGADAKIRQIIREQSMTYDDVTWLLDVFSELCDQIVQLEQKDHYHNSSQTIVPEV